MSPSDLPVGGPDGGGVVVVEADPEATVATTGGIVVLTAIAFVALFVWVGIQEPALLLLAPVLGVGLWWWARRTLAAEPIPTRLEVGRDRLRFCVGPSVQEVARADVVEARIASRHLGRTAGTWPILELRGEGRDPLLEVTLWDEAATRDALRAQGWLD